MSKMISLFPPSYTDNYNSYRVQIRLDVLSEDEILEMDLEDNLEEEQAIEKMIQIANSLDINNIEIYC